MSVCNMKIEKTDLSKAEAWPAAFGRCLEEAQQQNP